MAILSHSIAVVMFNWINHFNIAQCDEYFLWQTGTTFASFFSFSFSFCNVVCRFVVDVTIPPPTGWNVSKSFQKMPMTTLFSFFLFYFKNAENETIESSVPPGLPPGNPAQTVIDIIAVFGAMFVAAVAIILITVYIRWEDHFCSSFLFAVKLSCALTTTPLAHYGIPLLCNNYGAKFIHRQGVVVTGKSETITWNIWQMARRNFELEIDI